jgi:hypothetical protein
MTVPFGVSFSTKYTAKMGGRDHRASFARFPISGTAPLSL